MRRSHRRVLALVAAALLAPAALAAGRGVASHEIPADVTVLAFVRPEGSRLRLLVRVPLEAIRDVEFPLFGPGYLDIPAVQPLLGDAARLWIADYLEIYEGDRLLEQVAIRAARIALPSDRSFATWQDALAGVGAPPLAAGTELPWQQAMLDVLLEYPITTDRAQFSVRPALAHLGIRTVTVLRFQPPDSPERVFRYEGDPGLVRLDPRWHQAFVQFVKLGFRHILGGLDHLLFVFCLVIPFRRLRPLIAIVTSFTLAHSITLMAAAFGFAPSALWFPPLIETLIALSILYMAFENIVGARLERRWLIAFGFGLVHGFGFSFLLRESLQFAGAHVTWSLLAFNLGVELGQVFVLLLAVPALEWLFRRVVAERVGTIILSALVAHTAWHWMIERGATLADYEYRLPALDFAFWAHAARALMLLLIVLGFVWLLHGVFGRLTRRAGEERPAARAGG